MLLLAACTASNRSALVRPMPSPTLDAREADADEPAPDAPIADQAPAVDASPPAIEASATPATPAAPAQPRVTFERSEAAEGPRFHAEGLPAQSADGRTVAVAVPGVGPMRGSALRVLFLDAVTGHTARAFVAASDRESEQLESEELTAAQVTAYRARAQTISAALDALHARPLVATPVDAAECEGCTPDDPETRTASVAGWSLRERGGLLTVHRGPSTTRPVARHPLPRMRAGCRGANAPYLAGLFAVAPERLLLHVEFHGNDSCWEGPGVWQIVPLPRPSR